MVAINGGSKTPINLTYDPADRWQLDSEIAGVELFISDLEQRAAVSSDPDDYYQLCDKIHFLVTLYFRRCSFLMADIRRVEASMIDALTRPARVSDSSEEVAPQQEFEIGISSDVADDWEDLADNDVSLANLSLSSSPPAADEHDAPARRRGRGTFLYRTNELYSDQAVDEDLVDHDSDVRDGGEQQYGTGHALLLYDFPSTMRITQLESLFEEFWERGVVIRRVSYTVALAVFRTPAAAQEAHAGIKFPFKVRRLEEGDIALHKIPQEDLEPPAARPRTSPSTAQRMIGHAMGMEPGSSPGARSEEFRRQEVARRERLHRRHDMKDAAWGPD